MIPKLFTKIILTFGRMLYAFLLIALLTPIAYFAWRAGRPMDRPEFRLAHPQIPWASMVGMRDHLVHAYDLVDWDEVWETATRDVPGLFKQIGHLSE